MKHGIQKAAIILFFIIVLPIGFAWIGFNVAVDFYPWKKNTLLHARKDLTNIIYVIYSYSYKDFSLDRVIIRSNSNQTYLLHQKELTSLPFLPGGDTYSQFGYHDYLDNSPLIAISTQGNEYVFYNGEWNRITDFQIHTLGGKPNNCFETFKPRINFAGTVVDSAGLSGEHALAEDQRCYVLKNDGSLDLYSSSQSVFDWLLAGFFSGILGLVIGICACILLLRRTARGNRMNRIGNITKKGRDA